MSDTALFAAAQDALQHAFAPYSGFPVGAAVRSKDGRIFSGCNVEVSSFSQSMCAERVAVFKAVSEGAKEIVSVAVVTPEDPPASPCGACRQVLHDFGPGMVVYLCNMDGAVVTAQLSDLLPNGFSPAAVLRSIRARHGS